MPRDVQITTAEDYGKDLVDISEIELHRWTDNKEISEHMNDAIEKTEGLWDDPLRIKVRDPLERLISIAKGWSKRKYEVVVSLVDTATLLCGKFPTSVTIPVPQSRCCCDVEEV